MCKILRKILEKALYVLAPIIPDRPYVKWLYYSIMGRRLDLAHPQTMNEKLCWLKLHQRDPQLTQLVDKIAVKDHVARLIGEEYVCPLIQVWDSPADIDFEALPDQFVLKTNHSGGNTGVIVCADKKQLNVAEAKAKLEASLHEDIYLRFREWPYKDVPRKVFAEQYLGDNLADYKFYCFNGHVDCVLMCIDRQLGDPKFYFFDSDWQLCRYNKRGKQAPADFTLPRPKNIGKMFELASKMSEGFPFVRMDFYDVDGKIYFGEYTFYPSSGCDPERLPESDLHFGSQIDLTMVE